VSMTLPSIDFFRDGIIGTTVATVRCNIPRRIRGQRSTVGPVLQLPLEAVHERSAKIMMLYGVLKLAGENEGITIPAQSFVINDTQLRIPMTDEEFARIETHRAGKEIAFELWLRGWGTLENQLIALASNNQGVHLAIPREDWIRVLGECGYGTRRLIELPPAPSRDQQKWDEASALIQGAAARLASGDAGGAMTQIRNALQRIVESVGDCIGRPRTAHDSALKNYALAVKGDLEKKHQDKTDDPYQVLADAVQLVVSAFGFASDPPHNDLDAAERTHAELAIAVTAAIYCYCARTIKANGI